MVTYITFKCMAQLSITLFIYVLYEIDKIISFFWSQPSVSIKDYSLQLAQFMKN